MWLGLSIFPALSRLGKMAGLGLDHEYLLFGLKIPCLPRNQQAPADPRTLHGQGGQANLQLLTNFL